MDLSQLFATRSLLFEIDEIIGEDMNDAHQIAVKGDGLFGPVMFKSDTLDQLLAFSESEERDDGNVSLQGFILRKMAKIIYDGGENQQYSDVLNLHRDARALLEISRESESALAWCKSGYQAAIDLARKLGLPVRAEEIEDLMALSERYLGRIPAMNQECPCYNMERMKEVDYNKPDDRPETGKPIIPGSPPQGEKPLVEA